ncbi:DUF4845 domain-containing protein [Aliikangiella marina]|nr:DUF4845 domain-containing protein [Aliikangiella marina]
MLKVKGRTPRGPVAGRYQSGLTTWSMLTIMLMAGLILYVSGNLLPAYMEHGIIKGSMQEVVNQRGFDNMTATQIHAAIQKRMVVDSVRGFDKSSFKVSREKSGKKFIVIDYDKKVPLFGNISALIEFEEEIRREGR